MNFIGKIKTLSRLSGTAWLALGLVCVAGLGYLDVLTGYEIGLSLFYLIPIVAVSWFAGWPFGVTVASASSLAWYIAEILSGPTYSSSWIPIWNSFIRLTFFFITVFSVKEAKELDRERSFSRVDYTTGAMNSRFFRVLAQREIDRSARSRQPFTAAYVDLDNFKMINDVFGHTIGDEALRTVADTMQQNLRKTDIVARLGGDEFTILLPEVGANVAWRVVSKLHDKLTSAMQKRHWPITFSIGVVSFSAVPSSVDEMLGLADKVMYRVKHGSKNGIRCIEFPEPVDADLDAAKTGEAHT